MYFGFAFFLVVLGLAVLFETRERGRSYTTGEIWLLDVLPLAFVVLPALQAAVLAGNAATDDYARIWRCLIWCFCLTYRWLSSCFATFRPIIAYSPYYHAWGAAWWCGDGRRRASAVSDDCWLVSRSGVIAGYSDLAQRLSGACKRSQVCSLSALPGVNCICLAESQRRCQKCAPKSRRLWLRQRQRWSVQRSCRQAWRIKRRGIPG